MANGPVHRKSFIDSLIKIARNYGFHGLELHWYSPSTSSNLTNIGILLQEWQAATESEAKKIFKMGIPFLTFHTRNLVKLSLSTLIPVSFKNS